MAEPQLILVFVNQALNGMLKIAEELGDERINQRPDLPEANTPYAIMAHCVGLAHYWIGRLCTGRQYARDRDAEFTAHGSLAEMQRAIRALQQQLNTDIQQIHMDQPIVGEREARHADLSDLKQGDAAVLQRTRPASWAPGYHSRSTAALLSARDCVGAGSAFLISGSWPPLTPPLLSLLARCSIEQLAVNGKTGTH